MPEHFTYKNGQLYCENVPVKALADKLGTPLYVYSQSHFTGQVEAIKQAFAEVDPLICYSVKANACLGLLRAMARVGCGFDAVSKGEIYRALRAGADPRMIVFAGVGKRDDEIDYALEKGILMFNVESESELTAISRVAARRGVEAGIALRLNPDVDPKTHKHISTGKRESKFGIDIERAKASLKRIRELKNLRLKGVHLHIGSQITENDRHAEAIAKVVPFIKEVKAADFPLEYINVGGGYGISYRGSEGLNITDFAAKMLPHIKETGLKMACEPGRYVSGNGGILLTRVIFDKPSGDKNFLIVDAAMNDLIRPAIYDAYHKIWPVQSEFAPDAEIAGDAARVYDVVGPVCESTDVFAKARRLPATNEGELLAIFSAGAYGMAMSSTYNQRPRAAEVIVQGDKFWVARERESIEDLIRGERLTPREVFSAADL
ncbi:MAG: diaminopimelate decarboxylase [Planctomycetota bacterium]|nr:diaminopimelate decarboxylase [Planctomycetota bacterium]GIK52804.1 MAG: diaminopimelate decarboxylase [Planctomycetota bacterium]